MFVDVRLALTAVCLCSSIYRKILSSVLSNTRKLFDFTTFSFNQVDSNKDRLVTLEEFLKATEKKEFLEPDSWEVIEPT